MNLNHLYYFRALAEIQHYAKAAELLCITQPSLSYAISNLEKELGVELFIKKGRNMTLSPYGRIFLKYVTNALNELEAGQNILHEIRKSSFETINLDFIYHLSSHYVPALIESFQNVFQSNRVFFNLHYGDSLTSFSRLRDGSSDFALVYEIDPIDDIDFIPLIKWELVVILPKKHLLASYARVNLYDLEKYPLIMYPPDAPFFRLIQNLFFQAHAKPDYVFGMGDTAGIIGLVVNNLGVAIVPNSPTLSDRDVEIKPLDSSDYRLNVSLAYLKNKPLSPSKAAFLSFIRENYSLHKE